MQGSILLCQRRLSCKGRGNRYQHTNLVRLLHKQKVEAICSLKDVSGVRVISAGATMTASMRQTGFTWKPMSTSPQTGRFACRRRRWELHLPRRQTRTRTEPRQHHRRRTSASSCRRRRLRRRWRKRHPWEKDAQKLLRHSRIRHLWRRRRLKFIR